MPDYTIQTEEMSRIMELMYRVLDIRITFYDPHDAEVDVFPIKKMSAFCRKRRRGREFRERCDECDRTHLAEAKRLRDVHIYHCHAGLWEGIVPLYNRRGVYLGSIVFGQLADRDHPPPGLRRSDEAEMRNIGKLLKYLSEYICENELVRQCARPWSVQLEEYLDRHPAERITLRELARQLDKSVSFLSHNIPLEFGMTLKAYLRRKKMEKACELLQSGRRVNECAFALGYADEFYFSRDFKRFHGFPPSALKPRS